MTKLINPMDLSGKLVVVTGASSGIGRETAILLSKLGARIILLGRSRERLFNTLEMMEGSGHRAEVFDLTATDELSHWMRLIAEKNGKVDGVAHCAGAQILIPLRMLTTKHVEDLMRVNLVSAIMLAKAFRQKGVNNSGGAIVFVSSVMGEVGSPGRSLYGATKGAIHALTKSLAIELSVEKIRVNCVAPGAVATEMLAEARHALSAALLEKIEEAHPLGLGFPGDVANMIAFLLADSGRWVTGSILLVDGGYTAQ
jgi:NAD(P)-dependent dehydrogenase (short-subunit alcohol dehydrogenase family)